MWLDLTPSRFIFIAVSSNGPHVGPWKTRDLGIKEASNGHGDVTAVSTGPPPVMPLGIPHPGGGVVLWIAAPHRPRFGALLSLLCSSVTRKCSKSF